MTSAARTFSAPFLRSTSSAYAPTRYRALGRGDPDSGGAGAARGPQVRIRTVLSLSCPVNSSERYRPDNMSSTSSRSVDVVALNADVVGYSQLMADDLEATTEAIGQLRRLVDEEVKANDGTMVNFVGDNFMAVFSDPKDAMQAAIKISNSIEERNAGVAAGRRLRLRMGLDQGRVTVDGENYFGDALNIAARIQAIAVPGGISISRSVYRALDEPALRFRSIGAKSLKNIPGQVEVFQFADLPSDEPDLSVNTKFSLAAPTVAVLPIHSDSLDPGLQSVASVIRDDLIYRLSQVPRLGVVDASGQDGSRSSDLVRYLLETGIHQVGEQVRVYAKLFDVTSLNIVTTQRWTSPTTELLALSDEIAEAVARSIAVELIIGEPAGLYIELGDPEAIQNIYTGWFHLTSGSPEGWAKAVEYFGKVASSHPEASYGHALSSFAYWMSATQGPGDHREDELKQARLFAETALGLGDPTGLGQMVLASVLMAQGDVEGARERIDNLVIARPTCDVTYAVEGSVRRYMGDWEKSVDLLDKAQRLTAASNPWYSTVQACSLYHGGRVEQAAATAEAVIEHQPSNLEALLVLAAAQVEMGMNRRARATAELIKDRFPAVDVDNWLAENPYQKREMVDRWKDDLIAAGVFP